MVIKKDLSRSDVLDFLSNTLKTDGKILLTNGMSSDKSIHVSQTCTYASEKVYSQVTV